MYTSTWEQATMQEIQMKKTRTFVRGRQISSPSKWRKCSQRCRKSITKKHAVMEIIKPEDSAAHSPEGKSGYCQSLRVCFRNGSEGPCFRSLGLCGHSFLGSGKRRVLCLTLINVPLGRKMNSVPRGEDRKGRMN